MKEKETHTFGGHPVRFQMDHSKNLMVNATEMAKIFDKQVNEFTSNSTTKAFIEECLKNGNSRFLEIESIDDLITSKQRTGTWMHRILALKFAAWLNPAFELWVYTTIDHILFEYFHDVEERMKESARRRAKMEKIKEKLLIESEEYRQLQNLELKEKQARYKRSKAYRDQLSLFIDEENLRLNNDGVDEIGD